MARSSSQSERTLDGCEHPRMIAECGTRVSIRRWVSVIIDPVDSEIA